MQHIYRQITALVDFETFVITKFRQNADVFPFRDVEKLSPARQGLVRRGYLKYLQRKPALLYRGKSEAARNILIRRDPAMMHIYFGNTGVHLLPLIQRWDRPCLVSFHGMDVQNRPKEKGYEQRLRELLQLVPLVLVRSQSIGNRLQQLGCNPDKIRMNRTVIPLGGIPEAVEDGKQGYLVAEQDAAGLAAALVNLASNRELWRQFQRAASAKVFETFEQSRQVSALEAAYRETLELWRRRPTDRDGGME